ncbi:MAG TPA: hypothetical protein VM008_16815 [Phycisphaerae bacterium]|nr:hypothetical protein [Phycisphaerae bacterium]
MQAAHGADAVALRISMLDDLNKMSVTARDRYVNEMLGGSALNGPWAQLLKQTDNPDAQLNSAILIASAKALSADGAFENIMLPSTNAAVRYWGARGLEGILADLIKVGTAAKNRALEALNKAIAKENSGVVKQQIIRALGAAGDVEALQTAADALAMQLQNPSPDHETIDAAGTALSQLDALLKKGATVDKAKVAKSAAWIAAFSAQQLRAVAGRGADNTSPDAAPEVPEAYTQSIYSTVSSAIAVLNDLAGKGAFPTVHAPVGDVREYSNELQFAVDGIAGSATAAGTLQKLIPGVPVPPAIRQ